MKIKKKPFLTAEWRNLINLTYAVDPELLLPHLPPGLELDVIDGNAHLSLVAFDFLHTLVKGIKIPFHVNFPEVNLRFYVRYKGERGVVFLKEYVPRFWIAYIARKLYNEPYAKIGMESEAVIGQSEVKVSHLLKGKYKQHRIEVRAENSPFIPEADSQTHYFKEHEWGFGKNHSGKTLFYQVVHPVWEVYPVSSFQLDFDFGALYGEKWAFLNEAEPLHKILALGSKIQVFQARDIADWDRRND